MNRSLLAASAALLAAAAFAQTDLDRPPPGPKVHPPSLRTNCLPTLMTVRQTATDSPPASFGSLARALQYAGDRNLCAIEVTIEQGQYTGNLTISRRTILRSRAHATIKGSIRNESGYPLVLDNLRLDGAHDTALLQQGGTLTLRNVDVTSTQRRTDEVRSGTAIELHGAVKATFSTVTLQSNQGVALYLNGAGTVVKAENLLVRNNRVHPTAKEQHALKKSMSRVAAIDVAFGAALYVDRYDVSGNEMYGLLARDGGLAHFRNGSLKNTSGYRPSGSDTSYGGENVMSWHNARIELNGFESSGAQGCGLRMAKAYLKTAGGQVHDNAIGFCVWQAPTSYDPLRCVLTPTVRFFDNGSNFSGDTLPVPDPSCSLPNPPPECTTHDCPGVPWP